MKNTLKVVLADDEALIRLDIREMLTEAGHEVAAISATWYQEPRPEKN